MSSLGISHRAPSFSTPAAPISETRLAEPTYSLHVWGESLQGYRRIEVRRAGDGWGLFHAGQQIRQSFGSGDLYAVRGAGTADYRTREAAIASLQNWADEVEPQEDES